METAELDRLKEILQPKLSEALTSLTHQSVELTLDKGGLISITKVHQWLDNPEASLTAVYIPIMGDVTGDIFVFLPHQSALAMVDLMVGNPIGATSFLTDFETSAIKELGNITTGVIVTEIANSLKLSMMLTVPNLANDMVGALIDQVLIEYGETTNTLLALNFPFHIRVDNHSITGSFVLFFNQQSSALIAERLGAHNKDIGSEQ